MLACTTAKIGERYCIGAQVEKTNIDLVNLICHFMDDLKPIGKPHKNLIRFVMDRPGHDQRYGIDPSKIMRKFNWRPKYNFEERLYFTVKWYLSNLNWCNKVQDIISDNK